MKLTVMYWPEDKNIDIELDKSIEAALMPLGFERWASGYSLTEDFRDIAFEKPNKET